MMAMSKGSFGLLTVILLITRCGQVAAGTVLEKSSNAAAPAPLGLQWGMSKAQVRALGATLSSEEKSSFGEMAVARNLPKALSDSRMVVLQFGFDDQLWCIGIFSNKWAADRYGFQAKERFDELNWWGYCLNAMVRAGV
jgi:hypothetical protein